MPHQSSPCLLTDRPVASPHPTRREWLSWTGGAGLATLLPGCSGRDSEGFAATKSWGRQAVRDAMKASGTRAVSLALRVGDDVVWQEAFGVLDDASASPASVNTRFNIGSVSKVICALAVTILVDRKLVGLDTPVVEYLPQFSMLSPTYRGITPRQLLSHASGLPGTHLHNLFATAFLPGYAEDMLAALADVHLKHAPGELAVYCNDGFTLTECVVHAVTGQTYPEFVQSAILAPLGMSLSGYTLQPLPAGSFAHGYLQGERQGQEFVMGYATGGLCTTPGDMMKLAALFLNKGVYNGTRIVSEAGVAEMGTAQTQAAPINPSPEWQWGLGWDTVHQPGLAVAGVLAWEKNGGTTMYTSDFYVLPQEGMALMITGSGTSYNPGAIAEGILLRALQEDRRIARLPPAIAPTVPPVADEPPEAVQSVLGIYGRDTAPLRVSSPDGMRIDLHEWTSNGWHERSSGLQLRTDGWWWSDAQPGHSYRWQTNAGHTYLMWRQTAHSGFYRVSVPLAERMPAAQGPLPARWAARMGSTWRVINEDPSSLIYKLPGGGRVTLKELVELPGYVMWDDGQLLTPLSADRAGMSVKIPMNSGRDLLEVVAQQQDGTERLHASGWILAREG